MKTKIALFTLSFCIAGPVFAQDAKTEATKVEVKAAPKAVSKTTTTTTTTVTATTPASQPALAPVDPSVKQPTTPAEALDASKDFVGAVKAKRWWFAVSGGIFLILFVFGIAGLWTKIGTFWAWIAVGVLSLAAGVFAAFDKSGFSWSTLLGYLTAGPTIAWGRDFIKDVILKKKEA